MSKKQRLHLEKLNKSESHRKAVSLALKNRPAPIRFRNKLKGAD